MRGIALGLALLVSGGCGGGSETEVDAEAGSGLGPSPLAGAQGLLQAGDFEGAEAELREVTEASPDNAQAWAMLGLAVHSQERWEEALDLHLKAAELPATAGVGHFRAGLAQLRLGRLDEAFDSWGRAKETGGYDVTQLGLDPAADSLRDDPRYIALFPTAAEFADPFVESVTILQEWAGEGRGDQFGWIARNIGDVDGDGIADVATSAPTWGPDGSNRGRVYVYSGASGARLWTADGEAGDQLGLGIEAAGDVNGDGIPDVIAGAPGGDRALVWSGRDGSVLLELAAEEPGGGFGGTVSDVGDADGDGRADVLVGAPGNGEGGEGAGAAYLYSGADGSELFRWIGEEAGDAFGSSGAGWVGADGRGMVVVGAPGAGPGGTGRVYVYGVVAGPEGGVSRTPAFVVESDENGAALGAMFVSVVGDVDGDGTRDVYASDWAHGALGPQTGRIHVHSGASGERLMTLTGEAAGDGFGIGPADAGDVDGDGHDDLVIGAWQHAGAAASGGKIYFYSGADGAALGAITGQVMGETFGFDATGMGDVDGDGTPDMLITSAWSAIAGARSGRVFILSGREEGGR
jgi:hypothetical protein